MAAKIRMPRARAAPASKNALFALAVSGAGTIGPTPSEESELSSDNMAPSARIPLPNHSTKERSALENEMNIFMMSPYTALALSHD
jgi:hypothetical protein